MQKKRTQNELFFLSQQNIAQNHFYLEAAPMPATTSLSNLSEFDRRVSEFNHRRPKTRVKAQQRVTSWSDPRSARETVRNDGSSSAGSVSESYDGSVRHTREETVKAYPNGRRRRQRLFNELTLKRSAFFFYANTTNSYISFFTDSFFFLFLFIAGAGVL